MGWTGGTADEGYICCGGFDSEQCTTKFLHFFLLDRFYLYDLSKFNIKRNPLSINKQIPGIEFVL